MSLKERLKDMSRIEWTATFTDPFSPLVQTIANTPNTFVL